MTQPPENATPAPVSPAEIEIEGLDRPDHVTKLRDRLAEDLPDYEIQEELGRGGVGVVFKARHAPTNEVVALKILMMAELASPKQRARFEEEAEITKRLEHPGIVPIRAVGMTSSNLPFFTMKFVDGPDLAAVIREPGFTTEKGLAILKDVALAVQTAHAQGIVHRDLKPENIKIEKSSGRVYVLDFGLAKSTDAKEKNLTVTGALLGTPYYMSYEQALGRHRDVDARTDVYALGAMLYVILTGKPPFDADSAGELFAKIIKEEPRPPRRVKSDVPRSLELVTLKALKKNKDERQQDAGAFARDLDNAIATKDQVPPEDEESVFSDKAPSAPGTASYGGAPKSSHDDDSMFADEVGAPGSKRSAAAPGATPAPAAPASGPHKIAPPAPVRVANSAIARTSSGSHKTISDRVRPGEGTASRARASSSSPDLVLDPARASRMRATSSGSMPAIGQPSDRRRREDPAFDAAVPGAQLGEWFVRESLGEEDGIRIFEVEKNGRTAVLREHPLPSQGADDLVAFAERLVPVRSDDLEPLLGSGRSRAGAWYVVDERVTFRTRVAEKGPFAEKDALAVLRSAARGLASLAQRNLLHGDPSPRKILFEANGLVRLGSPVRVRNANVILGAGPITGDARYAAPSVLDGQAPVAADDVFTLGLTFAFLLAGKDPIPETDPTGAMIARSRLPNTVPDLATLVPEASEGARALYAHMTERDPARRPTPAELAAEVEALISQGRVPMPAPPRKALTLPRPVLPVPLALLLAVAAVIAAVAAVGSALTTRADDPTVGYQFRAPADGK
ncbi:MAG: protein kinase [Planctomycetota bacterium]